MNLHTPGNGLFETHVTWEDIEKDMLRELQTKASFGPRKSAKDLAEGIGFLSKMLLIDPDWQNADKELPKRFVVKILTQMIVANMTAEMSAIGDSATDYGESYKKAHNTEVLVYNYLIKHSHGRVLLPKIYHTKSFTESNPLKGYIIMEYLGNARADFCSSFDINSVKEVFPTIAAMEAMSLKFTTEERNQFTTTFYQQFYGKMCEDNVFVKSIEMLRTLDDGRFNKKVDKLEAYANHMLDPVKVDRLADDLGMQRVLCHGDLWTGNVLWVKEDNNELKANAIIDFQCAHLGCPAVDIASMLLSCLSGKDRQEHWTELLELFYSNLKEEVGDMKMPYTFEQLKESYCQCLPFIGFTFLPFMIPFLDKMRKENIEENKQKLESLLERMDYLLDDMISFYKRNKEKNLQTVTVPGKQFGSSKLAN
ncbi:unnamed protein product [Cylicocyclus nassatus]|uniref:CHK kinase-like domain-containing protein n=1 Tax=Cylicocyclus nassatus TaxID=53992 RepID=A0AA36HAX0_CYLNA|nr:unnamed protein product [Cylicocyclus nassatus]